MPLPVEAQRRATRIWVYVMAALVVLMVMVGGATRLTDSGLSIVEWRPVTGAVPPLSEADWLGEFAKYKTSSEYALVNKGMSLTDFKRIYWWEWSHRLLGRIIGAAFLLPLMFFLLRGWSEPKLKRRLWCIFALGALQGAIGWWMVASGLVGRVDVAQERLAVHLTMACIILLALVWTARSLAPARATVAPLRRHAVMATAILALVVVQIALGGLVAGLKAGLVYDTWPLIDGAFIPAREHLFFLEPAWANFLDNHLFVQFVHRITAYLVILAAVAHALDCMHNGSRRCGIGAMALMLVVVMQAVVGIATLMWQVPVILALAHQGGALAVLLAATVHAHNLLSAPALIAPAPPPVAIAADRMSIA